MSYFLIILTILFIACDNSKLPVEVESRLELSSSEKVQIEMGELIKGADEIFAGYAWYKTQKVERILIWIEPDFWRQYIKLQDGTWIFYNATLDDCPDEGENR